MSGRSTSLSAKPVDLFFFPAPCQLVWQEPRAYQPMHSQHTQPRGWQSARRDPCAKARADQPLFFVSPFVAAKLIHPPGKLAGGPSTGRSVDDHGDDYGSRFPPVVSFSLRSPQRVIRSHNHPTRSSGHQVTSSLTPATHQARGTGDNLRSQAQHQTFVPQDGAGQAHFD